MLTPDELAYMRETQAEARPTEAGLLLRSLGTTASGGRSEGYAEPVPIDVRIDGRPLHIPAAVTAMVGSGKPVMVTLDMVEVRAGDRLTVGAWTYELVTDGNPGEWATAQIAWAKVIRFPARA